MSDYVFKKMTFVIVLTSIMFVLFVYDSLNTVILPMPKPIVTDKDLAETKHWNKIHGVHTYVVVPNVGVYFERKGRICWVKKEDKVAIKNWMKIRNLR